MLTIGLTGDVGAGKSTLCRVWRSMGAVTIDADTIARDMWSLPGIQRKAEKRWGEGFFAGDIKTVHAAIAARIFGCAEEYEFASNLIQGAAVDEIKRRVKASDGLTIAEIPLLFECGLEEMFDGIVFAAASLEKRAERNVTRGWNSDEVIRRDAKLMPREIKMRRCRWILKNTGTVQEWEAKARKLGEEFLALSKNCYS